MLNSFKTMNIKGLIFRKSLFNNYILFKQKSNLIISYGDIFYIFLHELAIKRVNFYVYSASLGFIFLNSNTFIIRFTKFLEVNFKFLCLYSSYKLKFFVYIFI